MEATDRMLSTQEVADFLGVPVKTLYAWKHKNAGLRCYRVGKHLRYRREDVEAFLDAHADPRPAA